MKKIILLLTFIILSIGCVDKKDAPKATPLVYKGVNLSGAESGSKYPGTEGVDYIWPTTTQVDYFTSKGMNSFRVNFMWERMQPTAKGSLDATHLLKLKTIVNYATGKGAYVLLNPQNFARYYSQVVGSTAVPNDVFADFWTKMANEFKSNPKVIFGLVNEPNTMATEQWRAAAQAAINSIRATGSTNLIAVPGNGWTGMHSWTDNWYGASNGSEMLKISDPGNNFVYEVHQYFDSDFGGGYPSGTCVSATVGADKAKAFVSWLRANNKKAILGEFGAPNNSLCQSTVTNMLNVLKANEDVVIGWFWWNSIRNNFWGNPYILDITPKNGVDDPRMSWLSPFLQTASPTPTPTPTTIPTKSPTFPTAPIAFSKETTFTTSVNGITNWVFIPNSYDSTHTTPSKLFVWLHGCGGRSQYDVELVSKVPNQTWISLAPGGREGACWSNAATDGPKVFAAIADIRTKFNIDPRQIFLGGYSSGGDIGYNLAFQNAAMFAGVLFENTGPNSSAMTASQTAAWKLNIAHLAHTGDTTYPITNIRTNMATLKSRGFPVTLIEKPGTHWDADTANSGTDYDLRTFLLPYLNAGWLAPTSIVDGGVMDAGTPIVDSGIVDSGVVNSGIVDSGTSPDSGTVLQLTVSRKTTYNWGSGYCSEITLDNKTTVSLSWSRMVMDLFDGKIRDENRDGVWDVWNGTFSARTDRVTVLPVSWNKTLRAGQSTKIGLCADFGTSKKENALVQLN